MPAPAAAEGVNLPDLGLMPSAIATRLLSRHSPHEIAEAIEVLVDVLDLLGGDPDKEDATDSEDDHALSPQATWVLEGNARLPGQRYRRVDWR
jgi:hypothetical protein